MEKRYSINVNNILYENLYIHIPLHMRRTRYENVYTHIHLLTRHTRNANLYIHMHLHIKKDTLQTIMKKMKHSTSTNSYAKTARDAILILYLT